MTSLISARAGVEMLASGMTSSTTNSSFWSPKRSQAALTPNHTLKITSFS